MGFGAIMLGAGYVIGHDQQNGVGIATGESWLQICFQHLIAFHRCASLDHDVPSPQSQEIAGRPKIGHRATTEQ